jgi:regulator of cell morphogenesis and NO signaling
MTNLSNSATRLVDPAWTVNELISRFPECMPLLNAHGVDTCCGGELPLDRAAREAGMAQRRLLDLLEAVAQGAR